METTTIFEAIQTTAQALHWSEVGAVVFGLIYIILAARENIWCWFWGILSCSLWAWATWRLYDLYADAILNLFYVVMGFVGWYQWQNKGNTKEQTTIQVKSWPFHLVVLLGGFLLGGLFGYFFDQYTAAAATYLDAITTVFAIITTFMVVYKILENWLYWIVIDIAYIYLYIGRGGFLFATLYMLYVVIAIAGFHQWYSKYKVQPDNLR